MSQACCEEQAEKLARQEARAMEEERAKKKRVQWVDREDETKGEGKEEMDWSRRRGEKTRWADVEDELHSEGRTWEAAFKLNSRLRQTKRGGWLSEQQKRREEESRMRNEGGHESKEVENGAVRGQWQEEQDQEQQAE